MATFVSVATCHHCPFMSSRRGLVYRDSLSALSRRLKAPGGPHQHPGPHLQGLLLPPRLTRPDVPHPKPPGSMKSLVLAHLRKLLMLSSAQQRGLRLPG